MCQCPRARPVFGGERLEVRLVRAVWRWQRRDGFPARRRRLLHAVVRLDVLQLTPHLHVLLPSASCQRQQRVPASDFVMRDEEARLSAMLTFQGRRARA